MRKNLIIAVLIISAAIIMASGCSDRGEKMAVAPTYGRGWGAWPNADAAFRISSGSQWADIAQTEKTPPQLLFQLRNPTAVLKLDVYVPKVAYPAPTGEGRRVPLLILLAPEDADQNFYRDRGLYVLMEEMMDKGEIEPMVVVTVGNDPTFGGYFYGNSYPAGQYDAIIGDTTSYWDSDFNEFLQRGLLSFLDNNLADGTILINSPSQRAIGGVGQGAYGAFRTILKHPGEFNSISVADGPLSFANGLPALFPQVIAEQNARWAEKGKTTPWDMTQFDTLGTMPLSRMFVGGALAFSPNHLNINYTVYNVTTVGRPDSVRITSATYWTDTTNTDTSATIVTELILSNNGNWDFHMPFDASGNMNAAIWQRWMDNDLSTLLSDAPAGTLDNVNIFVATSTQAHWYYHQMTQAWINTLGSNVDEVYEYQGYAGSPATDNQYIYDLMKRWLKFHSDNFETN